MPRTTPERVRDVIETSPSIDLNQFISIANSLTSVVATKDTSNLLSSDLLVAIETYLAAHFYALKDGQYESKSTDGASGKYQTAPKGKGLLATDWGQQAVALDLTGYLASIAQGAIKVGITWLGKDLQQQTDYWDRNSLNSG